MDGRLWEGNSVHWIRHRGPVERFAVSASSIPQATFDYLASLEWIRACAARKLGFGL